MTHPATPREIVRQLLDGVTGLAAGDQSQVDRLAALYAEQTRVSHPFAPLGDSPLRTREQVRRHFGGTPIDTLRGFHVEDLHLHDTADPEVVVAEFAYAGEDFRYRCVFVVRVRDGQIVESRDYVDHLRSARARGRLADLIARLD